MRKVDYPVEVRAVIAQLKRLPGIGPRSAERIAVWLLGAGAETSLGIAQCLTGAADKVRPCPVCGFFSTADGCEVCDDDSRDARILCIVEQPTDVLPLERSGAFRGYYHVLGGRLSPLDNVGPEDLSLDLLERRLGAGGCEEVILALGADVEGEATAHFLVEHLRPHALRVTQLAQGLPAGGGLEHADELTLSRALSDRKLMER